jgi:transcriptional regulator with XRE-family HTH domain
MTPDTLKSARQQLGLTQAGLAALMKNDARTIRRWESGEREIPGPVEVLMQAFLSGWRPEIADSTADSPLHNSGGKHARA